MEFYEILIIIAIISFLVFIFGREIYRKKKNLPTGECKGCHIKSRNLVDEYHKKYNIKK